MTWRTSFPWLILLFAAATVWAVAEPTPEELAQRRRKLAALRQQPEQLARLRQDLQSFQALSAERREQLVKLDDQLHHEDAEKQQRLWNVMKRYADWLEQLPDKGEAIKNAPDRAARLALIRSLRDQEWMRFQPSANRKKYAKLEGPARAAYIKELREVERQRQRQWQIAARFWPDLLDDKKAMPCRLGDFSFAVQRYVSEFLTGFLSKEEKDRLAHAEGRWPDYPQTLVEIAGKHPAALASKLPFAAPPQPKDLPRVLAELPGPIRLALEKKGGAAGTGKKSQLIKQLEKYEKKDNFVEKVVELGTNRGEKSFPFPEFWACNYAGLSPPMKEFVTAKLKPAIEKNEDHVNLLRLSEKSWPNYPTTILELSQKYHLQPPWYILPDAERYKWDNYRGSK